MSSLLDMNFDDVYEPEHHEGDKEVILRIESAKLGAKKDDPSARRIEAVLIDPANDRIEEIYLYLPIPNAETEPRKANKQKARIQKFYTCFDIDYHHEIDIERDLPGKEGFCLIGLDDDPQYGKRNVVKDFIAGH